MATYTNHSQHTHVDPNPVDDQVQARDGRTSPVLMGALAVALVALGVWWYAQRDDVTVDPQPAVTMVEPQLTTPAATETRPGDAYGTRDNSGADRARAAIANRAPQPLAGNPVPAYPRSALRAGQEGAVIVSKVRDLPWQEGYNAATLKYGDLLHDGVVDPVKVTRSALTNAASIARMVITTESAVVEKKAEEEESAADHGHGHGHGHRSGPGF